MKKTVEAYSNGETLEKGIGDEIKKKGVFRSVILPLFLSLLAAIGIWTYVATENNLVSGVAVKVYGTDILQEAGYTVSAIEPLSLDIVLTGRSDKIKQVIKDRSQITARVNLFKSNMQSESGEYYIFETPGEARPGPYTVVIEFILPEGVTCAEKEVSVIISEIASKP